MILLQQNHIIAPLAILLLFIKKLIQKMLQTLVHNQANEKMSNKIRIVRSPDAGQIKQSNTLTTNIMNMINQNRSIDRSIINQLVGSSDDERCTMAHYYPNDDQRKTLESISNYEHAELTEWHIYC